MIYDTLISRSTDGLLLCEVAQPDKVEIDVKRQIKLFLKKGLAQTDIEFMKLDVNQSNIQCLYKTIDGITYIVFFDKALNFKLACCYLDEIKQGFDEELAHRYGTTNVNYRSKIETIENNDSYCFQTYEKFIKKKKTEFVDQNSNKNMDRLKNEIIELQNIMQENIRLLIDREEGIQNMNIKARQLKDDTSIFKDKTEKLVWNLWMKKNLIWFIIGAFILIFLFLKFV